MAPHMIDDTVSFWSFLTPSISTPYTTTFSVALNSTVDRVLTVTLRLIFVSHFNSNLRPVFGVSEGSLCTVGWWDMRAYLCHLQGSYTKILLKHTAINTNNFISIATIEIYKPIKNIAYNLHD